MLRGLMTFARELLRPSSSLLPLILALLTLTVLLVINTISMTPETKTWPIYVRVAISVMIYLIIFGTVARIVTKLLESYGWTSRDPEPPG